MLGVVEVVLQFFAGILDAIAVAIHDLRPARDAWLNVMAKIEKRDLLAKAIHEVRPLWSRTHQAHLASENVNQLWQFIQAKRAQYPARRRHPVVVFPRPDWACL